MIQQSCDLLVLELARLMKGNQVDTAIVGESLKLICDCFSFDGGFIYEKDSIRHFSATERVLLRDLPLREDFEVKALHPECQNELTAKPVTYITKNDHNSPCEAQLIELLCVDSLAVAPIVDDTATLYGLIAFLNGEPKEAPTGEFIESMSVPVSMLVRYIMPRMYQNKLSLAHTSLEDILDNTGIDIYVNDFYSHEILYVNRSMAVPYGGREHFFGHKCWEVLFPGQGGPCEFCPQEKILDAQGEPTRVYTWDYQRPFDGSWFRVFSAAFRWVDGRLAHVVSSADITDTKKNEALIKYMANYDPLTNLPNRRMLLAECEKRINRATESEKGYILFFDIDGFKSINDNFGHDAGDEFLVKLGEFFSSIPMLKDSIYRNGGDEFIAIIGSETITKDNIRSLAAFIHTRFHKPWVLKNGSVFCNTSIGIACFPEDGRDAEKLLRIADMAMYQVKKKGGGGLCFGYELTENLPVKTLDTPCHIR